MRGVDHPLARLRLAIVSDTFSPQVNGVARTLERLVEAVERRGGRVHVETVAPPERTATIRVNRTRGLPFWAYPDLRIAAPSSAIDRRISWFGPTLVHVATPFGIGYAGRRAAQSHRFPLVTSYHTSFLDYLSHYRLTALRGPGAAYLRWFHNAGRYTFVPTEAVRQMLADLGFQRLRLWGRGVDLTRFHPRFRNRAMRDAMGAREGDFVVAYAGRLAPEKRIDEILAAVTSLRETFGDRVRLAIAGDGPDRSRLERLAPAGTFFAGMLSGAALAAFYASADAFAFASDTETFGNVLLEAMASGVPVVAPDRGPTTEVASDATALLFRRGSIPDLATQLSRLLVDPELTRRLQVLGLAEASRRSWDRVWEGLFEDYRRVGGIPRAGRLAPSLAGV